MQIKRINNSKRRNKQRVSQRREFVSVSSKRRKKGTREVARSVGEFFN